MAKLIKKTSLLIFAVGATFGAAAFEGAVLQVAAQAGNVIVTPVSVRFEAVFPQETLLSEEITLEASQSFLDDPGIAHAYYTFYQYPQSKGDPDEIISVGAPYFYSGSRQNFCRNHQPASASLADPYYQNCKPVLCNYLSKKKGPSDNPAELGGNQDVPFSQRDPNLDYELDAPHSPFAPPAQGHFNKNYKDYWQFDLAVPCFEGFCAQDYNPSLFGVPLPEEFMGQEFGCDVEIVITAVTQSKL